MRAPVTRPASDTTPLVAGRPEAENTARLRGVGDRLCAFQSPVASPFSPARLMRTTAYRKGDIAQPLTLRFSGPRRSANHLVERLATMQRGAEASSARSRWPGCWPRSLGSYPFGTTKCRACARTSAPTLLEFEPRKPAQINESSHTRRFKGTVISTAPDGAHLAISGCECCAGQCSKSFIIMLSWYGTLLAS